uniref:Odorant receptor n=1 Tax=Campoletis chlorideae TaxID=219166 RepID=A0A346D435_9HYME|nr:odorant receptor [Campoletis chlorideae]
MSDDFERAKDLFLWNKRAFNIIGIWPLERSYIKFPFWIIYLLIHFSFEMVDLYYVIGNLEQMVLNLSESTLTIMVMLKITVLRFSKVLKNLMIQILDSIDDKFFDDPEEKKIYLRYNQIAKSFFKMWTTMAVFGAIAYYMKPLEFRIKAALGNGSQPFPISYRTRFFFEINDSRTFWIVWLCQSPMILGQSIHAMSIGFLFSMILHVCGKLSVLSYRIKVLGLELRENPEKSQLLFRGIIETHCDIIGITKDIDSVFNLLLLEELFVSTVIVGLSAYTVLVTADVSVSGEFFTFFVYSMTMLFLLNGYCIAGEYLITESINVYDAYYQCQWYELTNSAKKQLMICMIRAMKPMQLTGGGFYIFCLATFTDVLKTIMGYISMLRTII